MDEIQALILGLVQGLTEYLPVSSSGHLEIGKMLLDIDPSAGGLTFDIVVHVATVLATLVILWREVAWLFKDFFRKPSPLTEGQHYIINILISMIPVGVVGFLFKDTIESIYVDNHELTIMIVGICLLVTAALLTLTHFYTPREKEKISPVHAFIIGVAQAVAVLPGLSRSGSTIATGLLLGNSRKTLAQFSFLMVIPPILGEALLDFKHLFAPSAEEAAELAQAGSVGFMPLAIGFAAAFISGCFACKWMISLVKKCKLIYFGIYCALVGLGLLIFG